MNDVSTKEYKQQRVDDLLAIEIERYQLDTIDMRLWSYISQVRNEPEKHNLYEILAVLKFLRLMDNYVFRPSKVKNSRSCMKASNSPAWMAGDVIS